MKLKFKAYLFLQYFALGIWGPYLPVFLNDKHFSGLQMGLLLGTMPIVMVIFQPVWGYLSDVLGTRRNLLVISSVSSGIAMVALGSAERFEFAFLWAMLFSALWTPIIPISTAILLETLEESGQEEKFSLVRLWGSVGFGVSSLLMGSLFLDQIVNTMGWFTGVTCFILAGASMLMPEKGDGLPLPEVKGGQILTKNPRLVFYLIASTFIGATLGIYNNYQTLFMQYLNAQSWLVGLTVSLQALVEVPFMLLVPYALKRFGMQTTILTGALVLPLRWLLYVFIQRPGWVAPSQVLHGVAIVSFFVVGVTYIDQLISPSWRATGQALYGTTLYGIGAAIGVYLAGLFIEWFDLRSIWVLNIVLGLIGLGLLLVAFRQKSPAEDHPPSKDSALPQGAED